MIAEIPKLTELVERAKQIHPDALRMVVEFLLTSRCSHSKLLVLEFIGDLAPDQTLGFLQTLLVDKDKEVRLRAAEAVGAVNARKLSRSVIALLNDKCWCVRLASVESLGLLRVKQALLPLNAALEDSNSLVRGYAAQALADLGYRKSIKRLNALAEKETSAKALVRIHGALWRLGVKSYFFELLRWLNARDYRIRCAAIHILTDYAKSDEKLAIQCALKKMLVREQTFAVRSTVNAALQELAKK